MAQGLGIPLAEAERRSEHQNALHLLVARASSDPAWGGLRMEHKPAYRVILTFADGRPRPELIALAPADLRPHIVFARAVRSRIEAERMTQQLAAALRPLKGAWNIAEHSDTGRFTVNVSRGSQITPARALIPPSLAPYVDVVVGPQIIPT